MPLAAAAAAPAWTHRLMALAQAAKALSRDRQRRQTLGMAKLPTQSLDAVTASEAVGQLRLETTEYPRRWYNVSWGCGWPPKAGHTISVNVVSGP